MTHPAASRRYCEIARASALPLCPQLDGKIDGNVRHACIAIDPAVGSELLSLLGFQGEATPARLDRRLLGGAGSKRGWGGGAVHFVRRGASTPEQPGSE